MAENTNKDSVGPIVALGKLFNATTRVVDVVADTVENSIAGLGDLAYESTNILVNGAIVAGMHSENLLGKTVAEIGDGAKTGRECAAKRRAERLAEKMARADAI